MKQSILSSMLTGSRGGISSKRGVMLWFVFLFTIVLMANLFWGKTVADNLLSLLAEFTLVSMGLVFGEPFINLLAVIRGQKTTSTTTTVAPENATVVTTATTKENDPKP